MISGREKKNLTIRLLKRPSNKSEGIITYHIVVAIKQSTPCARIDRLGSVAFKSAYSFLRLDMKKFYKYFREKHVSFSSSAFKLLFATDMWREKRQKNGK
jgi:hypothetical protein